MTTNYFEIIITLILFFIFREKKLCDVKLVAKNGEEIWAHKVILAANSDYFHCMFNSDFIESKQSEIFINEIDPVILKLLVDFIYTSQLVITEQHVQVIFFYHIL